MARMTMQTRQAIQAARRAGLPRSGFSARVERFRDGCWGFASIYGRALVVAPEAVAALRREGFSVRTITIEGRRFLAYAIYDGKGHDMEAVIEESLRLVREAEEEGQ